MLKWVVCVLLLAGSTMSGAVAQPTGQIPGEALSRALLQEARKALEAGNPEVAKQLLQRIDAESVPRDDFDFLSGSVALVTRDWETAIRHFRAILARDPSLLRVRLDLALAFFRNGDDSSAAYHFRQALTSELPPVVRQRALRFLEEIRRRKRWSVSFGGGLNLDDNRNTATGSESVYLCIPAFNFCDYFTLSDDARPDSGIGLVVNVAAAYEWPLEPDLRFRSGASLYTRTYENNNFNDHVLGVNLGPRLLFPTYDLRPELTGNVRRKDDRSYSRSLGLRLSSNWVATPRLSLYGSLSGERVFYETGSHDIGNLLNGKVGFSRPLTKSSRLTGEVYVGLEERDHDDESWRMIGGGLGLAQELPWGFLVRLSPSAKRVRYRGANPLYGPNARDDRTLTARLTVSNRNLALWGFRPRISFVHERRNSNLEIYRYSRNYGDIEWVRNF